MNYDRWVDLAPTWRNDWDHYQKILEWVREHPELATNFGNIPDREFLGQLSERVFSIVTGQPMRQVVGPDGGWDFEIPDPGDVIRRVDIKSFWFPKKMLIVGRDENFRSDYYGAVQVDKDRERGRLNGLIHVKHLRAAPSIERFCPKKPGHCLYPEELHPPFDWMYKDHE